MELDESGFDSDPLLESCDPDGLFNHHAPSLPGRECGDDSRGHSVVLLSGLNKIMCLMCFRQFLACGVYSGNAAAVIVRRLHGDIGDGKVPGLHKRKPELKRPRTNTTDNAWKLQVRSGLIFTVDTTEGLKAIPHSAWLG